jgi:hypothetical protein
MPTPRPCSPSAALSTGDEEGRPGDHAPLVAQEGAREQSGFGVMGHGGSVSALVLPEVIPRSVDRAKGFGVVRKIRRTDDGRRAGGVSGSLAMTVATEEPTCDTA